MWWLVAGLYVLGAVQTAMSLMAHPETHPLTLLAWTILWPLEALHSVWAIITFLWMLKTGRQF